jgi:hypothetical protein
MAVLACTDLDETVYSTISIEDTELTSDDLNSLIATAFISIRDLYKSWDGLPDIYEESSDCIVVPARIGIGWGDYYITMHQHTWSAYVSHVWGNWHYCFNGITNVNRVLYQLESIDGIDGKENYVAELRGIRAFFYYILFDNFRNVPIVSQYNLPEGYLPEQSSPLEVYNFIVSELTEALPLLSGERNSDTYGRFTKWAAKMTLAKLYLNHEVYFGTPMWSEAQSEVQDIIDCGLFSLAENYLDPFKYNNEDHPEMIFAIPLDPNYTGGSYYPNKTLHPASQATFDLPGQPWGGSAGIPQFIDTYDSLDSRLSDSWLAGPQYSSSGEAIMVDDEQLNYVNYMTDVNNCMPMEGYRLVKYEITKGENAASGNDIPLFRYTDVLMIKAECLLRQGQGNEAATIVSQIRARAFKDNPERATVTAADLEDGSAYNYGIYANGVVTDPQGGDDINYGRFLDELGWEFVGEHRRKQDLIRFGVYNRKAWLSKSPSEEYRKIFPIPQDFIDANPNLNQNPGYE